MDREETILEMAKAIQHIEHGGYHTWESCHQSARDRALRQAEACLKIIEAVKAQEERES